MLKSTGLAKNESNKPIWAHTPSLCVCVSLDKTEVFAYLVAMSGQRSLRTLIRIATLEQTAKMVSAISVGAVLSWTHTLRQAELQVSIGSHQLFARLERQSWRAWKRSLNATKMALDGIMEVPKQESPGYG
ncbi:hypothetical protein EAE99_002780 [Botrytis elliptica]|nr:hypothetical protein EAE99_002780 [Botrytis elliptica]